jgi:drug/metabolite transporter (DMT)-like permease
VPAPLLATALLLAEARARRERVLPPPGARGLALFLALSGVGLYQWLYALGLASTSGFSAALLNSVSPLIALLFVVVLGLERLSPLAAVSSFVAWGGVVFFVSSARGPDFGNPAGNLMCLGAATCWATYNVASARANRLPRGRARSRRRSRDELRLPCTRLGGIRLGAPHGRALRRAENRLRRRRFGRPGADTRRTPADGRRTSALGCSDT